LEKPVIPKPISLIILEIGEVVEVTWIDIVTHAYEVFKTPNILKDTPVAERPRSQPVLGGGLMLTKIFKCVYINGYYQLVTSKAIQLLDLILLLLGNKILGELIC